MLTPLSWLNDYVDIKEDANTFCDAMTMTGTKVEGFEVLNEDITNVVVGKIVKIEKHPDADKLRICQLDIGADELVQIVTAAPNVQEGDIVPAALDGANLAGGVKIKKGKLRGVVSNGMMCSVEELGATLADYPEAPEDGIYVFKNNENIRLGMDAKEALGLKDIVVEYEITSNRVDCNSMLGIAREVAATFDREFKFPKVEYKSVGGNANDYASVRIEAEDLCLRYAAKIVKNIKVQPSPQWMRTRLMAAGIRPINNIVDITNYVMVEFGQPMHAFDLECLANKQVIVRRANNGEVITTLDGQERKLDSSMLVIADTDKAVAIAGIMGGEQTKILDNTTTLLFESATFDGTNIRLSSKKLGLRTDASSKYEKGIDPNLAAAAVERACQLVTELSAGEVVDGIIDCYPTVREEREVEFNVERINKLIGFDLTKEEMLVYLAKVECHYNESTGKVKVPTYRIDLECNADLAEEVARLYGYDNILTSLPSGSTTVGKKSFKQEIEDLARLSAEQCGFNEGLMYSFESPKVFDKLLIPSEDILRQTVTIANPLGEDFSIMRTTTMDGMLTSLATNYNRRNKNAKLYEVGKTYIPKALPLVELPDERVQLTLGMYGEGDFFTMKGYVEAILNKFGLFEDIDYDANTGISWLHPGRSALIIYNKEKIGYIGEVHPTVLDNYSIGERTYVAVLDMPVITKFATVDRKYQPLAKFPAMTRDLSLLVKKEVTAGEIEKLLKANGGKALESVTLFDVYEGDKIESGYKSLAFTLVFRLKDRTLEEKEVSKVIDKQLTALEKMGVNLRK